MYKKIFFFSVLISCLNSCQSGSSSNVTASTGDSSTIDSVVHIDKQLDAKVFKDEKTAEIETPTIRDVTGFYKVIPDKFLPVSGKPESALKVSDAKQQYIYLEYTDKLNASIRLFKDNDTGREYLFIASHDLTKNTGKYYVLYLKAKHCIDVTAEVVPSLPDAVIKDAYRKNGLAAAKKPTWFIDVSHTESALYVYNSLDISTQKKLLTVPWKGGRFNY